MFDIDYFIKKFEAIPEDNWIRKNLHVGERRCALGHCGCESFKQTDESFALSSLFTKNVLSITMTNDGERRGLSHLPFMELTTPKQRVLGALKWIKDNS